MTKLTSKHKSRSLRAFAKADEAVSALEYAILVGVVSVALLAAFTTFNAEIKSAISAIGTNVDANVANVGTTPAPF